MTQWIRIGQRYINLDRVTDVAQVEGEIRLNFAPAEGQGCSIVLDGDEASQVLSHLNTVSIDLTRSSPRDREFTLYLSRGGIADREAWEEMSSRLELYRDKPSSWRSEESNLRLLYDLERELLL